MAAGPAANVKSWRDERPKGRFQYTVRSLLVLLLASALGLSILSYHRKQYWDQLRAVRRLREVGVDVLVAPKEGKWMRWIVGKDAYCATLAVDFRGKRVTTEMMDCLGKFFDLEQIIMFDCVVNNEDFAKIKHFTGVKSVYLNNTNLSDLGLKQFAGFVNMREFLMTNSEVSDDGLAYLVGMKKLSRLEVARCSKMSEDALVHMVPLTGLESLAFGIPISDKSIPTVKRLTQVKFFDDLNTYEMSPAGFVELKYFLGDRARLSGWN